MIPMLRLVVIACVMSKSALVAQQEPSPIPLEEGTQWVYEAKVQWTPVAGDGPPGVRSNQFKWTATVVNRFEGKNARSAVVHAWPDETGGMDPARPDGYSVLLERSNRLYRVHAANKTEAERLAQRLAASAEELPDSAEVYLELPLTTGKRWGNSADDPNRADGWYCWHVEAQKEKQIQVKGVPHAKAAIVATVAYRTNPSHELVEIAPGVGIIRYEFEHHGTVASADVRLIEFKSSTRQ